MSLRKRSLPIALTLLVASCSTPPAQEALESLETAQRASRPAPIPTRMRDPLPTRSVKPRPTPTPRKTPTPRPTPTRSADNGGGGNGGGGNGGNNNPNGTAIELTAYSNGTARSGPDDHWAFSVNATQTPGGQAKGQFLIASSIHNKTLFGTITGGGIARLPGGGGRAELTGVLTTNQTIRIVLTDANATDAQDGFSFEVASGPAFSNGQVYHGDVRLLRNRPVSAGRLQAAGYGFDSRIGMYILLQDLAGERKPVPEPVDKRVIEVTPPDPAIDFREDDLGGYLAEPGAADNQPGSSDD